MNLQQFLNYLGLSQNPWIIIVLIILALPMFPVFIFGLFKVLYFILYFNYNFIFLKNKSNDKKTNNENDPDLNKILINNSPIPNNSNNVDLSLIELKMLECNYKQSQDKSSDKQQIFRLEIEQKLHQTTVDQKLELIKYENILKEQKFEQQIFYLKQEIKRLKNDNNNLKEDKSFSNNENAKKIDLDSINEAINKQIPESLKKIFDKISDFENIQLFILNKLMDQQKKDTYYDPQKNILYINEEDLVFAKNLLNDKKKEQKRLS
ncbi:hypothetical protein ['Camptotheca acuminata' phytoplasma]|uniref:hypothetical protein n=1 Tax='Camptotheca acuminata' phytoplasma TaxID=3239192 RepID=UPI003519DEC6